nr:MAG TPA: hypothetical protein [Caudoviricetes sp.]
MGKSRESMVLPMCPIYAQSLHTVPLKCRR